MLNFVVGLIMRIYCCRCCVGSYDCFCLYSFSIFKHQWHCICALQYSFKREHPEEFELCIRRVCACILKHTGKTKEWVFVTTADICMNIQLTVLLPFRSWMHWTMHWTMENLQPSAMKYLGMYLCVSMLNYESVCKLGFSYIFPAENCMRKMTD